MADNYPFDPRDHPVTINLDHPTPESIAHAKACADAERAEVLRVTGADPLRLRDGHLRREAAFQAAIADVCADYAYRVPTVGDLGPEQADTCRRAAGLAVRYVLANGRRDVLQSVALRILGQVK